MEYIQPQLAYVCLAQTSDKHTVPDLDFRRSFRLFLGQCIEASGREPAKQQLYRPDSDFMRSFRLFLGQCIEASGRGPTKQQQLYIGLKRLVW